jgi:glucosyl-3-phosphoglycerate synthase
VVYREDVTTRDAQTRTHRWDEWEVDDLVRAKGGRRVSVVLPARDEEATIGSIVERIRRELVDTHPLVDELVVIDSDSTDATAQRAAAAGARVHAAKDIRPDLGPASGKGEALWKSLFVTDGDLLVFVDSDLTEWGTQFVTGLLGPLLTDDRAALVKACYHRPLDSQHPADAEEGGGRVTELVARPLLTLGWPELTGVIQPLAGEWAIRRDLVETLSFPSGYGVEIAVLIDTFARLGSSAIAQVDLGCRAHRHHGNRALGAMSLQVMAAVERRRGRRPADEIDLHQFSLVTDDIVETVRRVSVVERPPAVTVPGYSAGPAPTGGGR